jgi:hypothetical protein
MINLRTTNSAMSMLIFKLDQVVPNTSPIILLGYWRQLYVKETLQNFQVICRNTAEQQYRRERCETQLADQLRKR